MKKTLSSIICMLVVTLMWTPSSLAKDFSEASIAGCYVASLDGFFLDPISGQNLPTANLVRFCANGKGECTSVKITHNIAGCFILEQEKAGDVTYVVMEDGTGEVDAVVASTEVIDLCYGALPLPIVENERTQFILSLALYEDNVMRVLGTELILMDRTEPPLSIPLVIAGEAVRQSAPVSNDDSTMATGDMDGNGQDDVVVDFGSGGLWARMNNTAWVKMHPSNPDTMATGDMDGNGQDDVIVDFGTAGVWVWMNNTDWVKLHTSSPDFMVTGDMDGNGSDDVICDFGLSGIWVRMNNASWSKLHSSNPGMMATGDMDGSGQDEVVIDFPSSGLWVRQNNVSWTKLHGN